MATVVYVGVDIGGTSAKIGIFEKDGRLVEKWEVPTRRQQNGYYILPDICVSIKERTKGSTIKGIGVGVPGPITEDGIVLKCANLGWDVFSVKDKVTEYTGVKNVEVNNDANVAALGEMWRGGGQGYSSIVMVTLGTGVGGGIIVNGKILTGCRGAAGEIGHMKVERNETTKCGCGNKGCLEQYASATGIANMAKAGMKADSVLAGKEKLSAKMVFDAAKEGDAYAIEIVDKFGMYLGVALSNVAHTVDPDAFVIGGGVSKAGKIVLDSISDWYNDNAMFALKNKDFKLAELGNDAGIYGCAKMVLPAEVQ